MLRENCVIKWWQSQKQRKQIYLNYAADRMKENVYKYTQKWVGLKMHWGLMETSLTPKEIVHIGCGWTLKFRCHQHRLQLGISIPLPPAVHHCSRILQPGLETQWNLFCNRQRRLWSSFCRVQCSDSWKCLPWSVPGAFGQNQGSPSC